jgi:hypothetical protein
VEQLLCKKYAEKDENYLTAIFQVYLNYYCWATQQMGVYKTN